MVQPSKSTPVYILAGGVGQRLIPLTEAKPKPAVPFGGTHQIIDFTISNCVNSGLRKVYLLTQYLRDQLHDYIRESRLRLAQTFQWSKGDQLMSLPPASGKRYRGTADAVFQNSSFLRLETADDVLIASGDHVYAMDYRPLLDRHVASGAGMTIAAVRRSAMDAHAFGVLDVENDIVTGFREKPAPETLTGSSDVMVSMGIYAFKRSLLLDIADRATPLECDFGHDIIPKLIRRHEVAAYDFGNVSRNYWRDVGSLDSYFQANMDLLGPSPQFDPDIDVNWPIYSAGDSSSLRINGSRISCGAFVRAKAIRRSVISYGVSIGHGAVIEDSVILPGASVGKNVKLRNAIVAEGACIPDGVAVGMDENLDRARFAITSGGVVIVRNRASVRAA